MVVSVKDSVKLVAISIICLCAALLCSMFVNYSFDLSLVKELIEGEIQTKFYEAQVNAILAICLTAGCVIYITSIITMLFYVKNYIDTNKKNLGILKAIGYSRINIAKHFWVFALPVFLGCIAGFAASFLIMPKFYEFQNKDHIIPEVAIHFNFPVAIFFVILPTVLFGLISVLYAYIKLKGPVLSLIKDNYQTNQTGKKHKEKTDRPFLKEMKLNTLRSKKALIFFIVFSSFCFSAMTQMSFKMKDIANELLGIMMLVIGLVIALVTILLAITTVISGNKKNIAMMRVMGYSPKDCASSILNVYRPLAYIGFGIGTGYQFLILKMVIAIVFQNAGNAPTYNFDVGLMFISLGLFVIIYESFTLIFAGRLSKISLKEVMLE